MRNLRSLLLFAFAVTGQIFAQNSDPITITAIISDRSIVQPVGSPPIDLRSHFAVPTITGQVIRFTAAGVGTFNVETNAARAPLTVANFLAYVNANRLANTLVDRSDQPLGVIQGGAFIPNTTGTNFTAYNSVQQFTAITLEAGDTLPNVRGAIAMARSGSSGSLTVTNSSTASRTVTVTAASLPAGFGPAWGLLGSFVQSVSGSTVTLVGNANQTITSATSVAWSNNTATSGWFINTVDNTFNLPPASSGGYAAFGRVTGTGMNVVDAIANLPVLGGDITVTQSSTGSAFVTVDSNTLPSNFGFGWVLLGQQVQNVIGNFVTLTGNADRNINSATTVHYGLFQPPFLQLPVFHNLASFGSGNIGLAELVKMTSITAVPLFPTTPGGPGVVTFSAVSSNPGLVNATISGSNLYLAAAKNLDGAATVTVTATDTNGNAVSLPPFNVAVTRKVLDLNADGNLDFIFQNTAGQIFRWYLTATGSISSTGFIYTGGLGDWRLKGIADMNGDGNPDFVFQNTYGQIYVWYLTPAGTTSSAAFIYTGGLGDWTIAGLTDLNRDGKTDIILQNSVGQIYVWLMNGSGGISSSGYYYTGGLGDWRLVAIADLNSDGYPDFIFQNTAGQILAWYLAPAGTIASTGYIYAGGLGDWRVASVTDLNKDGRADIILQNTVGQIYAWYMNGSGGISSAALLYSGGLGDWRLR